MIWWQNRILTNVKTLLGDRCKHVTSRRTNLSASFPSCLVKVSLNNSFSDDLDNDRDEECAVYCGVTIEMYTRDSLESAMSLIAIANTAMMRMGFRRTEGPFHIEEEVQPELFRVLARYDRIIGSGDIIDKLTTE